VVSIIIIIVILNKNSEKNPDTICKDVKLCNAALFLDMFKPKDEKTCVECQLAVTTVITELKSQAVEQEIEKELQQVCAQLPSSFRSICSTTISQYTPQLIAKLAEWLQQENICKQLKICDN
jgi:hypothetical protein